MLQPNDLSATFVAYSLMAVIAVLLSVLGEDTGQACRVAEGRDLQDLSRRLLEGGIRRRVYLVALAAVAAGLCAVSGGSPPHPTSAPLLGWLAFLSCLLLSGVQSSNPVLSLRRLAAFLCSTGSGLAIGLVATFRYSLMALWLCAGGVLLIGVIREVAQRDWKNAWNYRFGGTLHPNQAGVVCVIGLLSTWHLHKLGEIETSYALTGEVALLGLLLFTKSRAACWGLLVSVVLNIGLQHTSHALAASLIASLAAASFAAIKLGQDHANRVPAWLQRLVVLGRPTKRLSSLNGRTTAWHRGISLFRKHPILGYGYGIAWHPRYLSAVWRKTGWRFSDFHSAYLDVALGAGVLGLLLYIITFILAIATARHLAPPTALFLSTTFTFFAVHGFFESSAVVPGFSSFALGILLAIPG
jgi:O-antigen ligase